MEEELYEEYEEEYEYPTSEEDFTEEDERNIEEAIMKRLDEEPYKYTYKIVYLNGCEITLQAIENEHYFIEFKGNTMSSYKKYSK